MNIQGVNLQGVAVQDASIPVGNNMLLYLDAGNPTSYPGSGTTWYDLSGNNNNTTSTTGTTYSASNSGYFTFNGAGYFTTLGSKYNVVYTGKTVFLTANLSSAMGASTFRNLFGSNSGSRNFNVYLYNNGSAYQIHYSAAGLGGFSSNLSYTPGNWFTAAVTQTTSGLVSYYFNGQPVGTNTGITFSQYISTGYEQVGASDNYWLGPISVACVYGSTLSAQQILSAHNAVRTRYGLS